MVGLFRKKPAKGESSKRKLKDFQEEALEGAEEEAVSEVPEEPEVEAGEEGEESAALTGIKEISETLGRLDEIEDKLGRLDSALAMMRTDVSQVKDRMNQTEQDIKKLLSVYEVVSAKFNPFIDISEKANGKPTPPPIPPGIQELELPPISLGGDVPEFRPYKEGEPEPPPFARGKPAEPIRGAPPWEPGTSTFGPIRDSARPGKAPVPPLEPTSRDDYYERQVRAGTKSKHNKKPLLSYISHDYLTLVLVMRWIEFLFERVTREKISMVLDYYVDVGWISEDVKSEVMSYARGEMQDVTKYLAPEETRDEAFRDISAPQAAPYKKVEDWRFSADDHLKSLLFIQKIAGIEVDKDRLNSLELSIGKFKESLEGFHGV